MNLLLLLIVVHAWRGDALARFTRVMLAIGLLSLESQLAAWLSVGTLSSLLWLNAAAAAIALLVGGRSSTVGVDLREGGPDAIDSQGPPAVAVGLVGLAILGLAMALPVRAADPYHLERVAVIRSTGSLAYDPAALDVKINALAGIYELLLADLWIPGTTLSLLPFHGFLGLGFLLLTMQAVQRWLPVTRRWLLTVLVTVPVVFQQLVLVKNDLFGAMPAWVALAWVVGKGREVSRSVLLTVAACAGFAVGIKISSYPIALAVAVALAVDRRPRPREVVTLMTGGLAGAIAGGLLFSFVENTRSYGGPMMPWADLGNRHVSVADAIAGSGRFALSLVDLGRVTPHLWPGRGGWGGTFGLPLIWALAALIACRHRTIAQRALVAGMGTMLVFALTYPDADLAHRLVLAPGLVMIAAALACVDADGTRERLLRRALVPVVALSALQVVRSAALYLLA